MKAIQIISQDLFDKIRSRFTNLEMGDESGAVTIDPVEARFFDFDFVNEGVTLGRVSISLNDLGSLKVYYSQGITENQDDDSKQIWYKFLKEMRLFAMRRLLRFDTRDVAKTNLDKNDFQHLATTQAPKEEEPAMNTMNESRWNQKSSRKTSRAVKGATEVIVRHHSPVDEMSPGARSRKKNIKAIFIQNRDGERFKYPFIHPAGAFAMAQHVDHGGVPHDPAGKAIIRMSEQIAQLQEFSRQVQHTSLHDDAMGITERAVGRLNELKAEIEALSKRHYYESWIESFVDQEEPVLGELDDVTMETYKQTFTQSSFKEELASFFPLLHSIMQETNTVDLEDYVEEGTSEYTVHCSQCGGEFKRDKKEGYSHCKDHAVKEHQDTDDFGQFVEWVEAVEQGKLTDDQIQDLRNALQDTEQLELGPEGQVAWQFFSSFGLTDSDLKDKLKSAADLDSSTDPIEVLQVWARDNYPELLVALGMSKSENEDSSAEEPEEAGADQSSIVKEVAKIVKSFYNRDNPEVGPFRGGEGIALDVEKKISEKFGESAGQQARMMAEKFMEKLTMEWEQRHASHQVDADDGLARLKELVGNIKAKVEEVSDDENIEEAKSDVNFGPEDIQSLQSINDLEALKAKAFELISRPSKRPMKPEKVEYFKQSLAQKTRPAEVIKLMYDLLLSGEGLPALGSRHSMSSNSYRSRFRESDSTDPELQELAKIKSLAGLQTDEDYRGFMERDDLQMLRDAIDNNVIVSVAFVKKDGTVRHMAIKRTLDSYVPSTREKTDKQKNVEQNNDIKKVVDVNAYIKKLKELRSSGMDDDAAKAEAAKGAWRSINLRTVLGFMVKGEFVDLRDENKILDNFGEEVYNSLTPAMQSALAQTQQTTESLVK